MNQFIFYVLGFEFVIAGMIMVYGINLKLSTNTVKILTASLVRFFVEIILIYLILIDYGIMAAAMILLVARFAETAITYIFCFRDGLFRFHSFILFIFVPIIVYFSYQMIL